MTVKTCDNWMLEIRFNRSSRGHGPSDLFAWDGGSDAKKLCQVIELFWASTLKPIRNSITFDMDGIGIRVLSVRGTASQDLDAEIQRLRVQLVCIYTKAP